jgi:hypothetical protein
MFSYFNPSSFDSILSNIFIINVDKKYKLIVVKRYKLSVDKKIK